MRAPLRVRGFSFRPLLRRGFCGGRSGLRRPPALRRLLYSHRRPRTERECAVNHDPFTGLQPFVYEPVIAYPVADHYGTGLGIALLIHYPDKMALGALLDGALGDNDGLGADGPFQARPDILVRPQDAIGVIDGCADQEGAGLRR